MKNRLPVEHFHFPVEKIKAGYYTDAYFLRTEEILNGDNHHPRVMMQLFTREPVVVLRHRWNYRPDQNLRT